MTKDVVENRKKELEGAKEQIVGQIGALQKQKDEIINTINQLIAKYNALCGASELCDEFLNTEEKDGSKD